MASAVFFTSHAEAGVSNPDYYIINITDGGIMNTGAAGRIVSIVGQMEGDIASDGSFAYNASAFNQAQTSLTDIKAEVIVGASGTSGLVDHNVLTFTLRMRLKFTGLGLPSTCQTGFFNVTLGNVGPYFHFTPAGFLYATTGTFQVVGESFSAPQVTAANCGGVSAATAINSTFNLGSAPGGMAMFLAGKITNPQIPVP